MLVCTLRDDEPDGRRARAAARSRRSAASRSPRRSTSRASTRPRPPRSSPRAGTTPAADDVVARLRERTAGNPFYIEETLHSVRDLARAAAPTRHGLVLQTVPRGIDDADPAPARPAGPATTRDGARRRRGRRARVRRRAARRARPVERARGQRRAAGGDPRRHRDRGARPRRPLRVPPRARAHDALRGPAAEPADARCTPAAARRSRRSGAPRRRAGAPLLRRRATSATPSRRCATRSPPRSGRPTRSPTRRRSRTATARWRSSPPPGPSATPSAATCCSRAAARCGAPARPRRRSGRSSAAAELARAARRSGALRERGARLRAPLLRPRARRRPSSWRCSRRRSSGSARPTAGRGRACSPASPTRCTSASRPSACRRYSREAVAMARRLGDDDALVVALASLHGALLHTEHLRGAPADRRRAARLVGQGRAGRARRHRAALAPLRPVRGGRHGRRARREHAPPERARRAAAASRSTATSPRPGRPSGSRPPARFEEAEALAQRSLDFARRAHMPYAESNYAGQLFGLRRDQGRLDTLPAEARGSIGDRPRLPVWRAGMVLAHLDAGDRRARPRGLRRARGGRLRRDPARPLLARLDVPARRGVQPARATPRAPRDLYERLAPYAERNAQIGARGIRRHRAPLPRPARGARARWAGGRAPLRGGDRAQRARSGAVTSLAHTRCDFADMLIARGAPGRPRPRRGARRARRARGRPSCGIQPLARRAAALARALA